MIFKVSPTGTFTTLHTGGAFAAGLTVGTEGNFYGTSLAGGTLGYGWVFKITPVAGAPHCTILAHARAALTPMPRWSKPATGTSTGRLRRVKPTRASMVAPIMAAVRSSRSHRAAH
jgi:hypothetical protein